MFWTRCYVTVPKSKRKQLAARGLHNVRAEPGRLVGWQGLFSSTYAVLLDAQYEGQQDRLVHSIDVTFNDADFIHTNRRDPGHTIQLELPASGTPGSQSEEANLGAPPEQYQSDFSPEQQLGNPLCNWPQATAQIEHLEFATASTSSWILYTCR